MNLDTWVITDTHFFHTNMIEICDRPMNCDKIMVENWMKLVQPEDTILHLGDIFMGPGAKEKAEELLPKLSGHKQMILGNHDRQTYLWYEKMGFEVIKQPDFHWEKNGKRVRISHYPETIDKNWSINIHGHIHNNGYAPGTPYERDYRNISVEVVGYRPWRLRDILEPPTESQGMYRPYQSIRNSPIWPLSKLVSMNNAGKLDEHLCEIDFTR